MTFKTLLSQEHLELDQLARRMLAIIQSDAAPPEDFSTVRWRMTHVLHIHLAKEDKHLYPQLMRSPDAATREVATRFAQEMGGLAEAYRNHCARWPIEAVRKDWSGFRTEAWEVMTLLRQRIRREETQLYTRLKAA